MEYKEIYDSKPTLFSRMMKKFITRLFICLLLLIFIHPITLPAWAGRVLDKNTGMPIEGVVIVRSWNRATATPAGEVDTLSEVKESSSDKHGRFIILGKWIYFSIPFVSWIEENRSIIYKPGYKVMLTDGKESQIYLEKVPTTLSERAKIAEEVDRNYETNIYQTKLLLDVIRREEEFVGVAMSNFEKNRGRNWRSEILRRLQDASRINGDNSKIESYILQLTDKDVSVRKKAAIELGGYKDSRAVAPLIEALKDNDNNVRAFAVDSLGRIGDPVAIKSLISALRDPYEPIRNGAVNAFWRIGRPAVEDLLEVLRDEDAGVRYNVVRSLAFIDDNRVVEKFIEVVGDTNSRVRSQVAISLGEFRDVRAIDALVILLKDPDDSVRHRATEALGKIRDIRVLEPLISATEDSSIEVRKHAVYALGGIKEVRAAEALIQTWHDTDQGVRCLAAESLVEIGPVSLEILIATLKHEKSYFRWRAARALGDIADIKAATPLLSLLKDDAPEARWSAIEALGKLKATSAIGALTVVLNDSDEGIKSEAQKALKRISGVVNEIRDQPSEIIIYTPSGPMNLEPVPSVIHKPKVKLKVPAGSEKGLGIEASPYTEKLPLPSSR